LFAPRWRSAEYVADLAKGFPLRQAVLVRVDLHGHGQPARL
jgi:hypothetical protein